MSRGHNFGGAKAQMLRGAVRERNKANVAELVANGSGVNDAGEQLGLTKGQTARLWAGIKADLGEQAC